MSRLRRLPITIAVPALVALLLIGISTIISERVMSRLVESQERQVSDLSEAFLDGLSSSLVPYVLREDIWEVYDTLDRARALYRSVRPIETVVVGVDGRVIAASDPANTPSLAPLPDELAAPLASNTFVMDAGAGRAFVRRSLDYQGAPVGTIYAVLDIQPLLDERTEVVATLLVTNVMLTFLFAAGGYLAVRRMVVPMRVLTQHLNIGVGERAKPIPTSALPSGGTEARQLFDAYNALVEAEREREALAMKLAEEERLGSLGRLASGMAHEINNPLGGLFNALDTLKRHGDTASVRSTAVSLLGRGLSGIKDVVDAALHTYRPDGKKRPFGPDDMEDLRLLIRPEIKRRALKLVWESDLARPVEIANAPLRQAVLNLLLNACAATPEYGVVALRAEACDGWLKIAVSDSGEGMPAAGREILSTPAAPAPIGSGSGLGLWMVRRTVSEMNGLISIETSSYGGSYVRLEIPCPVANAFAGTAYEEPIHGAA